MRLNGIERWILSNTTAILLNIYYWLQNESYNTNNYMNSHSKAQGVVSPYISFKNLVKLQT